MEYDIQLINNVIAIHSTESKLHKLKRSQVNNNEETRKPKRYALLHKKKIK